MQIYTISMWNVSAWNKLIGKKLLSDICQWIALQRLAAAPPSLSTTVVCRPRLKAGFWGRVDWPKLPSYPMFCKSFQSIAPPSLSKCKCCHCHRLQAASAGFSTWRLQLPGLWILQCAATGLWGILRRRWTCEVKTWRGGNYWKVVSSVSPTDECQGKMLGAIQQPQKITPVELKLKWLRASVNFVGNFFSGL